MTSDALGDSGVHARPKPAGLTIVVLPVENPGADPMLEPLCEGLTKDLVADLAALSELRIVPLPSAAKTKGQPIPATQIVRESGATHLLEMSLRKSGNRVLLTADLTEGASGARVWTRRYDRPLENPFAVQDELVRAVVTEMYVKLLEGEQARAWRRTATDPKAFELFQRAQESRRRGAGRAGFEQAIGYCRQAIALAPDFAPAHARLAALYRALVSAAHTEDPAADTERCRQAAERALELDPTLAIAVACLGYVALWKGNLPEADRCFARAQRLEPDGIDSLGIVAQGQMELGQFAQSLETLDHAIFCVPHYPAWLDFFRGMTLIFLGRYEEALAAIDLAIGKGYTLVWVHPFRILCLAALKRDPATREAVDALRKLDPGLTVTHFVQRAAGLPILPVVERLAELLRQAGVPE